MKVLIVGGTADGRKLATTLHEQGVDVVYSIAGLVRKATVPCAVISGGFTQFGGLARYLHDQGISHVVDATHPFAQQMSNRIAQVSEDLSIPAIRFHRLPWPKTEQDHWIEISQWSEVISQIASHQCVFVTAGQISQSVIDALAKKARHIVLRTAMPAKVTLPENVTWLKAIGPFLLAQEKALLVDHHIDVIISKNSGGEATYAKIQAAAQAAIPVYQFQRPQLKPLTYQVDNRSSCVALLSDLAKQEKIT
ncbi:precorrin-6A/cobalt-precorrin-6A reductase [Vibrio sp. WJH972]